MQSLSALLIPVLFILILENTWIPHEEEKLEEKFKDQWTDYLASTKLVMVTFHKTSPICVIIFNFL